MKEFQRQLVKLQHWCFALAHRENVNQSIDVFKFTEKKPTKKQLLDKYAQTNRDVHTFLQLDGWTNFTEDAIMQADQDGDTCWSSITHELRASPAELAVRVFVHEGTSKKDTLRLLKKIRNWIEKDWERLTTIKVS